MTALAWHGAKTSKWYATYKPPEKNGALIL